MLNHKVLRGQTVSSIPLVLLFLIAFAGGLFAQSTGAINGRVTDTSGAVVPGATVKATNTGTGISRTTVTGNDGLYNMSGLLTGTYDVQAEGTGLATVVNQGVTLVTATTATVNFELRVATTTQTAEVTSVAPMIDTTQSVVSETLRAAEVENLPILNRTFSGLVTLVPSARPTSTPANNKISLGGGIGFGGGAGRNGAGEIDGVAFRDDVNGGPLFNITLEGVQEFNVIAHDYPAQYGLTSGGIVLITTKSGTNQLHGSLFGYYRNQNMTALDYFSNPSNGGFGKPPYTRDEFGGSIGGPIKKDKLFVFAALENLRLDQSLAQPSAVYNQAIALKNNLSSLTSCPVCVTIGNSILPASAIPEVIRDWQGTTRADYQINSKHSLFGRYLQEHIETQNDILQTLGGVPHPDIDPTGSNVSDPVRGVNAVVSWTWLVSNKSLNTLSAAGTHFYEFQYCNCTLTGATQIYRNMIFPSLQVGAPVPAAGSENNQNDEQFKDTFSHQIGNHALKFGGDFIYYGFLGYYRNIAGDVAFFDDPSVIIGNTNGKYPQGFLTPGAMKTVLLSSANFGGLPANSGVEGGRAFNLFAQDDWKIRPGLTLNLGLHYSRYTNFYDQSNQSQNRGLQLLQSIGSPWGAPVHTFNKAVSPRIGLAWDMTGNGKNVLRASFGIFFDESLSPNMTAVDPAAQPLLQNVQATYTNTAVGAGAAATTVFGGALPGTLPPGLTNYIPGGNSTLTWLEPGTQDPYSEQSHIGYTRQVTPNTVISVDYTHVLGLHEWRALLVNPLESTAWDPNAAAYSSCPNGGIAYRRLSCAFNAIGLAPGTIGVVQINSSTNRSQFNEMIVHFQKRSKLMDFQASYILSYAYAFGGALGGTATGGGPIGSALPFNTFSAQEWGPSLTDERNRVVVSGVFRLPWGIQASPVFQYGSPRPYNCLNSADWTKSGGGQARCAIDASGNLIAAPAYPFPAGVTYATPNSLRGTATYNLDARFTKVFSFRERIKLAAFVELYNLTNKANFSNNYGGTFGTATFEKPQGYMNGGLSLPISRQMQVGARFTF